MQGAVAKKIGAGLRIKYAPPAAGLAKRERKDIELPTPDEDAVQQSKDRILEKPPPAPKPKREDGVRSPSPIADAAKALLAQRQL